MKLLKKTFALMLSLILVVGMIPGTLMTAHAAGTGGGFTAASSSDDWNLRIDEDGKLTWNSKGDTGKYTIHVDLTVAGSIVFKVPDVSATSYELKAEFEKRKVESGSYYVWVGTQNSGFPINSGTISTNYVSALPKLAEPHNVKWDGSKATWDSVPNATGYTVYLYSANGSLDSKYYDVTDTQRDFGAAATDGRWFEVVATADGYRDSNAAESPKIGTGTNGGFSPSNSSDDWNLRIDKDGKLTWNSKGDTGKYTINVDLTEAGSIVFKVPDVSATSYELKAEFEKRKVESGSYYVWVGTQNSGFPINSGTISTNYVSALPKLAEPHNVKWDGSKATWDSVPNATGYTVYLYSANGSLDSKYYDVTDTQRDFGAAATDGRWFEVVATADGYRDSNAAESPKYGEVVTPPSVITVLNATVVEPSIGGTPATTATTTGTDYTVSVEVWYKDATKFDETSFDGMFTGTSFEENVAYGVAIKFTAKEGKTIASEPTVTINGKTARRISYAMNGTDVTYRVKFDKLEAETPPSVITKLNATVVEPSIGGTPATTATTTGTDYTVSVSLWFEDATTFDETSFDGMFTGTSFEENVAYGVAIEFTAEEGKTIASEPTVTINGKTAHLFNYRLDGTAVTYRVKFDKLEAETPVPTEYDITVNGGTASANKAVAGTSITLTAEQIDGKVFSHWEVNGATVSDANAKETTFTMGNADVTAEAVYKDCNCKCHGNIIQRIIFMITNFFAKLFNPAKRVCECGAKH